MVTYFAFSVLKISFCVFIVYLRLFFIFQKKSAFHFSFSVEWLLKNSVFVSEKLLCESQSVSHSVMPNFSLSYGLYSLPGFSGFSRKEYWSRLSWPSLGDLPNPGTEPRSPALQAESLPSEPPGKPKKWLYWTFSFMFIFNYFVHF